MALLDDKGNYIRIVGVDITKVNSVINCRVYRSKETREKEKSRTVGINSFYSRCLEDIQKKYFGLKEKLFKQYEEDYVYKHIKFICKTNPEFAEIPELDEKLIELNDIVTNKIYAGGEPKSLNEYKYLDYFKSFGLKEEWLTDPIQKPDLLSYYSENLKLSSAGDCYEELKSKYKKEDCTDC